LLFLLIVVALPIRIVAEGQPLFLSVRWWFLEVIFEQLEEGSKVQIKVFYKTFILGKKEKKTKIKKKKESTKKKTAPKKERRKIEPKEWLDILKSSEVMAVLKKIILVGLRSVKSFKIFKLYLEIGLDDPYQQGLLCGYLYNLPYNKQFQVTGNFQEINAFHLEIYFSLLKFFWGIFLFVVLFPYRKALKVYQRVK
ncbi:MAG: hypothetical protein ACI86H_002238, partial [bacterium]